MIEALEAEITANNQTFTLLQAELEQKYRGQWIVIAHGEFLGAAQTPEDLNHLARTARHRIVVEMGEVRPHTVELGWQMMFV